MTHAHVVSLQPFLSSAARTTSGQSNGFRVDGYNEGNFFVSVSAISGTGAKLTIYPQISFDNSTYYTHPTATSLELTATGDFCLSVTNFGRYMRVKYDITGVSASVTFTVDLMAKD